MLAKAVMRLSSAKTDAWSFGTKQKARADVPVPLLSLLRDGQSRVSE
jgi:hypothetical protein